MKKRLLAITTSLVASVGAIVLTLALLPERSGVTKANFDRLEKGMSQTEVELVFDGKPGIQHLIHLDEFAWMEVDGVAWIKFNDEGRIERMSWHERHPSFYEKLQRWLPWLPD